MTEEEFKQIELYHFRVHLLRNALQKIKGTEPSEFDIDSTFPVDISGTMSEDEIWIRKLLHQTAERGIEKLLGDAEKDFPTHDQSRSK